MPPKKNEKKRKKIELKTEKSYKYLKKGHVNA